MVYQETFVQRNQPRIYVREHPGEEPTIILMHGFPDNLHLYDRLIPYLSPPDRVIAFDFLGWGLRINLQAIPIPLPIKSVTRMR
jgi:pimeloyl-ACP methyl ester carboxylesterase